MEHNRLFSKFPLITGTMGIMVGVLCVLLRPLSPNSFWSFSDIINCWGFWVTSVCLIVYFSKDKKDAGINSFTYLILMNLTYYAGLYLRLGIMYWKQLLFWMVISLVGLYLSRLVFYGKSEWKWSYTINACYEAVLVIEWLSLMKVFIKWHTHFVQLLFDTISIPVLLFLFNKTNQKRKYTIALCTVIIFVFYGGLAIIDNFVTGI